jgi:hypothetical protein
VRCRAGASQCIRSERAPGAPHNSSVKQTCLRHAAYLER